MSGLDIKESSAPQAGPAELLPGGAQAWPRAGPRRWDRSQEPTVTVTTAQWMGWSHVGGELRLECEQHRTKMELSRKKVIKAAVGLIYYHFNLINIPLSGSLENKALILYIYLDRNKPTLMKINHSIKKKGK